MAKSEKMKKSKILDLNDGDGRRAKEGITGSEFAALSFVVRRSSFVVRRSSFVVRRSSFVVHRSSLLRASFRVQSTLSFSLSFILSLRCFLCRSSRPWVEDGHMADVFAGDEGTNDYTHCTLSFSVLVTVCKRARGTNGGLVMCVDARIGDVRRRTGSWDGLGSRALRFLFAQNEHCAEMAPLCVLSERWLLQYVQRMGAEAGIVIG